MLGENAVGHEPTTPPTQPAAPTTAYDFPDFADDSCTKLYSQNITMFHDFKISDIHLSSLHDTANLIKSLKV